MIKIKDGKIELTKSCALSQKQLLKLKSMDKSKQTHYALNLMGLSKDRLRGVNTKSHDFDILAAKGKASVLSQFRRLLDNGSETLHRPLTRSATSKWIGVEIECLVPGEGESSEECESCGGSGSHTCGNCDGDGTVSLSDAAGNDYDVRCGSCDGRGTYDCDDCPGPNESSRNSAQAKIRRLLTQAKITNCSVKGDGSLSGDDGEVGVEVTVLFDAQYGFDKVKKVCEILNSIGASVNKTCGLHVHLDQGSKTEDEVYLTGLKFGKFLPILSKLVPESRRSNTYCKLSVSSFEGCRYHAVNLTSFNRHKTIEIRLHSGTTDARKIEMWVRLLSHIERGHLFQQTVQTFQGLLDRTKIGSDVAAYFDKRYQKFNPNDVADPSVSDDEVSGVETDIQEAI